MRSLEISLTLERPLSRWYQRTGLPTGSAQDISTDGSDLGHGGGHGEKYSRYFWDLQETHGVTVACSSLACQLGGGLDCGPQTCALS